MTLKTKVNSIVSYNEKGKRKRGEEEKMMQEAISKLLERERVFLLFKFLRDPTFGSLRDKKESCSTRKGLCVGTRFRDFPLNSER